MEVARSRLWAPDTVNCRLYPPPPPQLPVNTQRQQKQKNTVEGRFTDTTLIRTSLYNRQFRMSLRKALPYPYRTRLIPTTVNTDNGHLFLAQQIIVESQPR